MPQPHRLRSGKTERSTDLVWTNSVEKGSQWSSVYAVFHKSRLPRAKLLKRLVSKFATEAQPWLAEDAPGGSRPAAQTLRARTFQVGKGQALAVSHSYSPLAWLPEESGSWGFSSRQNLMALPMRFCKS
ncbi:MAG: hypothetical protein H7Z11_02805 [Verrucomicrobia bacterium]|nr:hypothetical protein [Leptolyngbya sp. ES-bin-22]